jgi:hypothetical protein
MRRHELERLAVTPVDAERRSLIAAYIEGDFRDPT